LMRRHRPLDAHEIIGEPFLKIVEEAPEIHIRSDRLGTRLGR
jgi:hypothetical protein